MAIHYGSRRLVVGAHYGMRDWLSQRVTAALMVLFTIVVLVQADYVSFSRMSGRWVCPNARNRNIAKVGDHLTGGPDCRLRLGHGGHPTKLLPGKNHHSLFYYAAHPI